MHQINSIYLVDDDKIFHFITKKIISETNKVASIISFYNGAEAIEYLVNIQENQEEFPEVILLDLTMPIMDGWEFLEAYGKRINTIGKTITIYIVSSTISPADFEKINHYKSVKDLVVKPITRDKFNYIIEGILN